MGRGAGVAAVAASAFAASGASAAAQSPAVVTYDDTFTTRAPAAPTGRIFIDTFTNADDPAAKPPPVSHFHLQLPPGARFDTGAVTRCSANDAALMAQGAAACPEDSQVGSEVFLADTGFPEPNRHITADAVFINEKDGLISVGTDRATGARVVSHGKVTPGGEDLDVPLLPGTPPDGATDVREDARFRAATGTDGRAYLRTPPSCPKRGYWVLTATYTFRDGSKQVKKSQSPCDRPVATPPLRVAFFHRQAAHAGRRGRIRIRASHAGRARITVRRGKHVVARHALALHAGNQRVGLPALPRGRYVLRVAWAGGARTAALTVR
jgi:hypothetical protein